MRRAKDCAPYRAGGRYAVAKGIIGEFDNGLVIGGSGNKATEGVVGINCRKNRALETGAFFANRLA